MLRDIVGNAMRTDCKYNTVLRDIGELHQQLRVNTLHSAREIAKELKMLQEEKEAQEKVKLPEAKRENFPGHTHGNLYTCVCHNPTCLL